MRQVCLVRAREPGKRQTDGRADPQTVGWRVPTERASWNLVQAEGTPHALLVHSGGEIPPQPDDGLRLSPNQVPQPWSLAGHDLEQCVSHELRARSLQVRTALSAHSRHGSYSAIRLAPTCRLFIIGVLKKPASVSDT